MAFSSEYRAAEEPVRLSVARKRNWGLVREREEVRIGGQREFSKKANPIPWCQLEAPVEVI